MSDNNIEPGAVNLHAKSPSVESRRVAKLCRWKKFSTTYAFSDWYIFTGATASNPGRELESYREWVTVVE